VQSGICDPFERELHGLAFDARCGIIVHLALLDDCLAIAEGLADRAAVLSDCGTLSLGFKIETVDHSLGHDALLSMKVYPILGVESSHTRNASIAEEISKRFVTITRIIIAVPMRTS
jgi:hypothetical protein